jgi:hypothetical protein
MISGLPASIRRRKFSRARSGRWPGPHTEKNRRARNRRPCWRTVGSDGLGRPRLPPRVRCHWLAMHRAIAPPIRADKWARRGRHALPRLKAWSGRRDCTGVAGLTALRFSHKDSSSGSYRAPARS